MKRPPLHQRRRWRIALAALVLPPAVWAAVLAVVPTDGARQTIVQRLSRASGRAVTLGRVRVGFLGGVSLSDLTIGAPGSGADPWLQVGQASINVSLLQLLFGQVEPTEINVRGLTLRALRRRDGRLELADFIQTTPDHQSPQNPDLDPRCEPSGLTVRVRDAAVLILDEPTGTRLELTGVEGWGTLKGRLANVNELHGTLNGGPFDFAAQLDRTAEEPVFEGEIRLRDASLRGGAGALAYLVPVVAGLPEGVDGRLALTLYLRGRGGTRDALRRTLVGHGSLGLDPVVLDGSPLLAGLGGLIDSGAPGRAGAVRADVTVKGGRVVSDNLTLDVTRPPVVLAGWTDFDGRVNYRLRTEDLTGRLPGKARDLLNELSVNPDDLADVRIHGTLDSLSVSAGGQPGRRVDDRQRLRDIGRRLIDRIRR